MLEFALTAGTLRPRVGPVPVEIRRMGVVMVVLDDFVDDKAWTGGFGFDVAVCSFVIMIGGSLITVCFRYCPEIMSQRRVPDDSGGSGGSGGPSGMGGGKVMNEPLHSSSFSRYVTLDYGAFGGKRVQFYTTASKHGLLEAGFSSQWTSYGGYTFTRKRSGVYSDNTGFLKRAFHSFNIAYPSKTESFRVVQKLNIGTNSNGATPTLTGNNTLVDTTTEITTSEWWNTYTTITPGSVSPWAMGIINFYDGSFHNILQDTMFPTYGPTWTCENYVETPGGAYPSTSFGTISSMHTFTPKSATPKSNTRKF